MPAKLDSPRKQVGFKFPPALITAYKARAKKLGTSDTRFVEHAIEAALGTDSVPAPRVVPSPRTHVPLDPAQVRAAAFRSRGRTDA